jgi:hypothetical protein
MTFLDLFFNRRNITTCKIKKCNASVGRGEVKEEEGEGFWFGLVIALRPQTLKQT